MKRVLMIAYHFPPLRGSSGIQRTLRFAKYLPEFGWEPIVLTAHPRAYEQTGDDQLADVPPTVQVVRAFALDAARHLAIGHRYPAFLARPDRWRSWWLGAVPAGLRLVRRLEPHVLWSTYPIATAHVIGGTLQRLTGLPWVADFRDPMAQEGYPPDARTWRRFDEIERNAVNRAARLVFTTPGALRMYRERYRVAPAERFALIENGYDEELFARLRYDALAPLNAGALTLLHSGIVYGDERNPSHLFAAVRRLIDRGVVHPDRLRLRFRAPVHEAMLKGMAEEAGISGQIETLPALPYEAALQEMLHADALLVLQAANCNEQIPAKLYEYLRSGKPILALTDPAGDTAGTLRAAGCDGIAPLDDTDQICTLLEAFASRPDGRERSVADAEAVAGASRRARTEQLATLLDDLV